MIVKNKSKRCIRVNKTVLMPGNNLLNKKQEEDFNKSIDFAEDLIENGVLEIPEDVKATDSKPGKTKEEKPADEVTDFSDLNAKNAVALVKDTFDRGALEEFYNIETEKDDPRSTVVRAIENQIEKIEEARDKDDENPDDEDNE